jgi:hypothetical protein
VSKQQKPSLLDHLGNLGSWLGHAAAETMHATATGVLGAATGALGAATGALGAAVKSTKASAASAKEPAATGALGGVVKSTQASAASDKESAKEAYDLPLQPTDRKLLNEIRSITKQGKSAFSDKQLENAGILTSSSQRPEEKAVGSGSAHAATPASDLSSETGSQPHAADTGDLGQLFDTFDGGEEVWKVVERLKMAKDQGNATQLEAELEKAKSLGLDDTDIEKYQQHLDSMLHDL